uniref:BTB domain-containing protein n=1 Tax=Panagrolaimus sp. ES5 TaxID=591445 RepID=A0AC34FP07_9BILA
MFSSDSNEQQDAIGHYYLLKSPTMIAVLPHNGIKYTATLTLKYEYFPGIPKILFECSPAFEKAVFFCQINDNDVMEEWTDEFQPNPEFEDEEEITIKKLSIFVNVVTTKCQAFEITPLKAPKNFGIAERLKDMWKNDPSVQCVIKCGNIEIKVIKPILAASSSVFNKMFENDMKEKSDISVEIIEFKPEIVEKMVEYCENDFIKEHKDFEEELFKIAHKYQIFDLMVIF